MQFRIEVSDDPNIHLLPTFHFTKDLVDLSGTFKFVKIRKIFNLNQI